MRRPCCDKEDWNKGAWSKQEDEKLIDYVKKHGQGCWRTLPKAAGLLRCGKSCRLRWMNYLRPDLKRGKFTEDEEDLIIKLHALLGNRWSLIAGRLPGRTDNEVKNYWNSHLRRKLTNMGLDPKNHRLIHGLSWFQNANASCGSSVNSYDLKPSLSPQLEHLSDIEKASNATSSLEEEPSGLPDLNLDLTFDIQSSSIKKIEEDQNPPTICMFDES